MVEADESIAIATAEPGDGLAGDPTAAGPPPPVPEPSARDRGSSCGAAPGLRGIRKAAAFLASLGPERAAQIMSHLSDDEVEQLTLEISRLRSLPPEVVEGIWREVEENAAAERFVVEGGVDFARAVLERTLGTERAQEVLNRMMGAGQRPQFEFLRRTPPEQIAAFLQSERPQTIAVVLANVDTALAAKVLAKLDAQLQVEVARRIAEMSDTSPEVVREIESVMRMKLSGVIASSYEESGGVKSLAEILNNADRTTERNVLEKLGEDDPDLAQQVRDLLFVFEDIVKLDDRSIQLVLKEVDQSDLPLALRGASDDVKEKIMSNLSQRAQELLREEMELQPPQRRSAVEEAQARIVAVVRKLEEAGVITIGRGEDDLVA
ncbi:Flagellar motor switch protein FliG [bacterium HR41]|nr:Flagellar motor switch protein FliG [bacterium HR41]